LTQIADALVDSNQVVISPTIEQVESVLTRSKSSKFPPNLVPLSASIPADLLTPTLAYLRISADSKLSFLYESAATTGTIGRYSFVGADPLKVIKTGPGHGPSEDPLPRLQEELSHFRVATVPGLILPPLTGGVIGYVGYDCVRYFEPKTARPMQDVLGLPESFFMLFDTIVAFDHFFNICKIITYLRVPETVTSSSLAEAYQTASATIQKAIAAISNPHTPLPHQPPIKQNQASTSNIGQTGYSAHVTRLKTHITRGDIIQAVPSHRIARPTTLHPFNIYRHLRTVNPSPYLFYIDCEDFSIVGASPELLVKEEAGRIITHPIAGTVKRSLDPEQDEQLAEELRNSIKDRAEHVMLVDLARNDINRVCHPLSTRVDRLMVVEKFSHVQHLVSQVSGVLREGQTRWDAFRSIFPAGTVSGAPKVKAMELIAELEGEKRGVYAGAVGYFGFSRVSVDGSKVEDEGAMDTCIALRTMVVKDGVAYLQAGGGIVFDSDEEDEWQETVNKLGANVQCISSAEEKYLAMEGNEGVNGALDANGAEKEATAMNGSVEGKSQVDLVAG
jgi:anthranilate synthase component I